MTTPSITNVLVPSRFLITLGFLIATILVLYERQRNIEKAIYSSNKTYLTETQFVYDINSLSDSTIACCSLTLFILLIQIITLVFGCTFFEETISTIEIIFNLAGGLLFSFYIIYSWHPSNLWYIFLGCCVIPILVELRNLLKIFWWKEKEY